MSFVSVFDQTAFTRYVLLRAHSEQLKSDFFGIPVLMIVLPHFFCHNGKLGVNLLVVYLFGETRYFAAMVQ